ncbi:5826_t:CDS:1 [Paraglomus brasilianum]|uniref:5826_t:CDS:1 n=1 Tax=Paraglomus brasilianum TaxID=144538 RepID=A0A9N9FYD3_9GLOM|nr:5826_t:CDS:1 [Paraglomus brasilianum]
MSAAYSTMNAQLCTLSNENWNLAQPNAQLTSAMTNMNGEINLDILIQGMDPLAAEQIVQYLTDQLDLPMENTWMNHLDQEQSKESNILMMENYSSSEKSNASIRPQELSNPVQSTDPIMNQNQSSIINNQHRI